ncbi:hypothetical protein [Millisia brevis]|nr:hypothetical protein [Millisia brevis]
MTDRAPDEPDEIGDPVCWLSRVCPECGAFITGDPADGCPRCGAIPDDER